MGTSPSQYKFWAFFVPNNGGATTSYNPQQLWCIICHLKQTIVHALNGNTIPIKGFITYSKENDTSTLSKHVACDHVEEFKRWGSYVLNNKRRILNLKIDKNIRSAKVQCCLKLLHSLGIRCHVPKMTLFKKHSWKICLFLLLKGIAFYP